MNNNVKRTGNLYVALVVILMAVAIIAAVAGAMSRSRQTAEEVLGKNTDTTAIEDAVKNKETEPESEDVFKPSKNEETNTDETTQAEEETEKTEAKPLPEFINPTNGSLLKEYSVEVPVFSVTMEDYRTHNGIDIYVQKGLRSTGAQVTTRCYGYTASAATIVAQAASPGCREIAPTTLYLVHNSLCSVEGNADDSFRGIIWNFTTCLKV